MKKLLFCLVLVMMLVVPVLATDPTPTTTLETVPTSVASKNITDPIFTDPIVTSAPTPIPTPTPPPFKKLEDGIKTTAALSSVKLSAGTAEIVDDTTKTTITTSIKVDGKDFKPAITESKEDSLVWASDEKFLAIIPDPTITAEYKYSDTELKETITLKRDAVLTFPIDVGFGKKLVKLSNGDYRIQDTISDQWWQGVIIKKPYGIDANGKHIEMDYTYESSTLNLVYDRAGISYPLTIDPTYVFNGVTYNKVYPVKIYGAANATIPVRWTIWNTDGVNSTTDIHLGANIASNFNDIAFANEDASVTLPAMLNAKNTSMAEIYVDTAVTTTGTLVNMFYNSTSTSLGNYTELSSVKTVKTNPFVSKDNSGIERKFFKDTFDSDSSAQYTTVGSPTIGSGTAVLTQGASSVSMKTNTNFNTNAGVITSVLKFSGEDRWCRIYTSGSTNYIILYISPSSHKLVFRRTIGGVNEAMGEQETKSLSTDAYCTIQLVITGSKWQLYIDGTEYGTAGGIAYTSGISNVAVSTNTNSMTLTLNELTFSPPIAYSDAFTTDTSTRYATVSGTAITYNTDHLDLVANANSKYRFKSYKFQDGNYKTALTLPASGNDGDYVYTSFRTDGSITMGSGVGVIRGNGAWNYTRINGTEITDSKVAVAGLSDGGSFYVDIDYAWNLSYQNKGQFWGYVYTTSKPTTPQISINNTSAQFGYYGIVVNSSAGSKTFQLNNFTIRAQSLVGYTNIPVSTQNLFVPVLRGAMAESFWNGTHVVNATYFGDTYGYDRTGEYTIGSSATVDTTNGYLELKGSDPTYPNNISVKDGYYSFTIKRSTGATDVFNTKIANNDITVTGAGVITVGGTAYTGSALTSQVKEEFVVTDSQIAVYSNGVYLGTKTGLTLSDSTVQMSRTTANIYVYDMTVIAKSSSSTNGVIASVPPVGGGARYDTNEYVGVNWTDTSLGTTFYKASYPSFSTNATFDDSLTRVFFINGTGLSINNQSAATNRAFNVGNGATKTELSWDQQNLSTDASLNKTFYTFINYSAWEGTEYDQRYGTLYVIPAIAKSMYYGTGSGTPTPVNGSVWTNFSATYTYGDYGTTAVFTDLTSFSDLYPPTAWNWSFGDGNYSEQQNPTYVYHVNQTCSVTLNASNSEQYDSYTRVNYIDSILVPYANFTQNQTYNYGIAAVKFTNMPLVWDTGQNIWQWNYTTVGETEATTFSTSQNPEYTFTYGNHSIKLRAWNSVGMNISAQDAWVNVSQYNQTFVSWTRNVTEGPAPLTVIFNQTCAFPTKGNATWFNWSFGDNTWGNTSVAAEANRTHTYSANGNYTPYLIASDRGYLPNTSASLYVNASAYGWTQQDIWMTGQYVLNLTITDATTGLVIPSVQAIDHLGVTHTTSTGTFTLTYSYSTVVLALSSTGYASKYVSYVMDDDRTETATMTAETETSTSTWYTPHQVRFVILNSYGAPVPSLTVNAVADGNTLPSDDDLRNMYGINPIAANEMLNETLIMTGPTGTDGAIVFTMHGSIGYNISMTNPVSGDLFAIYLMPLDNQYNIWMNTGTLLGTNPEDSVYLALQNTTLWFAEPNASYIRLGVNYTDISGKTSNVYWYIKCQNNGTVVYSKDLGNPGTSKVWDYRDIVNQRGYTWVWNYTATRLS